jgi:hypothetical protein
MPHLGRIKSSICGKTEEIIVAIFIGVRETVRRRLEESGKSDTRRLAL